MAARASKRQRKRRLVTQDVFPAETPPPLTTGRRRAIEPVEPVTFPVIDLTGTPGDSRTASRTESPSLIEIQPQDWQERHRTEYDDVRIIAGPSRNGGSSDINRTPTNDVEVVAVVEGTGRRILEEREMIVDDEFDAEPTDTGYSEERDRLVALQIHHEMNGGFQTHNGMNAGVQIHIEMNAGLHYNPQRHTASNRHHQNHILFGRQRLLNDDDMTYEQLLQLGERIGPAVPRGTPAAIVSGFPSHRYNKRRTNTEPCSICQDEYSANEKILTLPCSHEFHSRCIRKWLEDNNTCPVCRWDVNHQ